MPNKVEFQKLIDDCVWTWTAYNEVYGYKVTVPNGNSIFLPAAGFRKGRQSDKTGVLGYYWSSTPVGDNTYHTHFLFFSNEKYSMNTYERTFSFSVRPVCE